MLQALFILDISQSIPSLGPNVNRFVVQVILAWALNMIARMRATFGESLSYALKRVAKAQACGN